MSRAAEEVTRDGTHPMPGPVREPRSHSKRNTPLAYPQFLVDYSTRVWHRKTSDGAVAECKTRKWREEKEVTGRRGTEG